LTDGEALGDFIERREARAFEILLRRHGRMVLGVCRRLLGNPHDADDAFQATFLVLVRKADSIKPREAVGNWLYGVAYRTALVARAKLARRRLMEKQVEDMPHPQDRHESCWNELRPLLDQELHRLPDKYRLAVVLCDLEGRSRKDVARQLAIPEGTLSSRLATARKQLAQRLVRHGFALSSVSLGALLVNNAASACVAPSLMAATTKAALLVAAGHAAVTGAIPAGVAALTKGVMKTMFLAKMKTLSLVMFGSAVLTMGTGGLWYETRAGASDPINRSVQSKTKKLANETFLKAEPADDENEAKAKAAREAFVRNDELQQQLEKARKESEELRSMVEKLQKSLELERAKAELSMANAMNQLNSAQKREVDARKQAEKERYASQIQQANTIAQVQQEESHGSEIRKLEDLEKSIQAKVEDRKQAIMKQLKELEDLEKNEVAKIKQRKADLLNEAATKKAAQAKETGDKLDLILQRLEKLEKRIDGLDKGK
jgi:RNA polymerase sigma factor (sigma-70 family)